MISSLYDKPRKPLRSAIHRASDANSVSIMTRNIGMHLDHEDMKIKPINYNNNSMDIVQAYYITVKKL